jgi:hypothetical protein
VGKRLLSGEQFNSNDFDWPGPGNYFWQSNPLHELEYAKELTARPSGPKAEEPHAVGAVIDCEYCLDLFSSTGIEAVRHAYKDYWRSPAPRVLRCLKMCWAPTCCSVAWIVQSTACAPHQGRSYLTLSEACPPIYENSGFFEKTHIQICVANVSCIKGVLRCPVIT